MTALIPGTSPGTVMMRNIELSVQRESKKMKARGENCCPQSSGRITPPSILKAPELRRKFSRVRWPFL